MTEHKNDDARGASHSDAGLERIACEAGLYRPSGDKDGAWYGYKEELANFAELIAAAEREACAQIADDMDLGPGEIVKCIRARSN